MAGVAGLPDASNINECGTKAGKNNPAKIAANPVDCRTFVYLLDCQMRRSKDPIHRMAIQLLMELIQNHRPSSSIARQVKVLEAWG